MRSRSLPVAVSQILMRWSSDTVTNHEPSGLKAISLTQFSFRIRKSSLPVRTSVIAAVLSFPAVARILLFGLKAMARIWPLCFWPEMMLRSIRFQIVTTPLSEPADSQIPFGLKLNTRGLPVASSGELTLPVSRSRTGIFPSL